MCGRYALALRPSQIRRMLQDDNMPVDDAPDDGDAGDHEVGDGGRSSAAAAGGGARDGVGAPPRQSYNFAPGYHGIVYRADVPDWGAGPKHEKKAKKKGGDEELEVNDEEEAAAAATSDGEVHYKLQSMKWGLIPFWTKRNPDYPSMMKTINCRDDSLAAGGGMWSTMKARKRCIVIAQGFYEWLKTGPKEKIPHYVKRKDGRLLCLAGLWDCAQYEDDDQKHYTYTIITTDSNKQLKFLHDRMPVILDPGSEDLRTWLDPARHEWSKELQALLRPFDGELECYPVSKEVGKVGNNSPSFIIPVASKENKSNIANFFAKGASGGGGASKIGNGGKSENKTDDKVAAKSEAGDGNELSADGKSGQKSKNEGADEKELAGDQTTLEFSADTGKPAATTNTTAGVKRKAEAGSLDSEEPPGKMAAPSPSPPKKSAGAVSSRPTISSTKNSLRSPSKQKARPAGTQKITKFFSK